MELDNERQARARTFAVLLAAAALLASGCATTTPPTQSGTYLDRIETQVEGNVRVAAAVLSPWESNETFGLSLAGKGVQAVWMEIDNGEDHEVYLMLLGVDPDYFAPSEVAWRFRSTGSGSVEDKMDLFVDRHVPVVVPPRSAVSGFVYTNLDPGIKAFTVELFGEGFSASFEFVQLVPGFEADFMQADIGRVYAPEDIREVGLDGLRPYVQSLPCCVLGGDRKTAGDPLNLVIVGNGPDVLAAMVRRGWDLTETVGGETTWRTIRSSLFRSRYRTSPVSPLYMFGRPQDAALQKARDTVDERNHLRLWRAPVTVDGRHVWVGQVSRDIGVKLSRKTFVTHKIDPYVDEARLFVTLDLAGSQSLRAVGYVAGVGASDRASPRLNYTDDPYYTDGLRVVLVLGDGRYTLGDLDLLPWEMPPSQRRARGDRESPGSVPDPGP